MLTVNSCNNQIAGREKVKRKNYNKRVCQFSEQNSNPQSYTSLGRFNEAIQITNRDFQSQALTQHEKIYIYI